MAGRNFEEAYRSGSAPWDIGKPQPVFEALARSGKVRGRVLDAGCGTGEHALLFASLGCEAWGVDSSQIAIERAVAKANQRGVKARFMVADALELERLGHRFDHVLDCGLLHVFDDADRARYLRSVHAALRPGGAYHVLCMRDVGVEFGFGPRRLREGELRGAFGAGWRLLRLEPAQFETQMAESAFGAAWFAEAERA